MPQSRLSGPVGFAVNPASGKDIRRLVARASVFDNQEKKAIVRRAAIGAIAAGAREFRFIPDTHGITRAALEDVAGGITFAEVDCACSGSALDTLYGARALEEASCPVVITLGGDGTNRAFARGWRDAPLIPISTGTNNVFPAMIEATVAGAAAGLLARRALPLDEVAQRAKVIDIAIEGESPDLALIDAVATDERFVGARALLDCDRWKYALVTRAEPTVVGICAVAGLLEAVSNDDEVALRLQFGAGGRILRAPIAPGMYRCVHVSSFERIALDQAVQIEGPGVLALDGERERVLKAGQRASMRVRRDGPWVIDVEKTMTLAAERGFFDIRATAASGETHAQ